MDTFPVADEHLGKLRSVASYRRNQRRAREIRAIGAMSFRSRRVRHPTAAKYEMIEQPLHKFRRQDYIFFAQESKSGTISWLPGRFAFSVDQTAAVRPAFTDEVVSFPVAHIRKAIVAA